MFIVYSKENCQPCKTAISLLEDKGNLSYADVVEKLKAVGIEETPQNIKEVKEPTDPNWISINDEPPIDKGFVFLRKTDGEEVIGKWQVDADPYSADIEYYAGPDFEWLCELSDVTHWRQLTETEARVLDLPRAIEDLVGLPKEDVFDVHKKSKPKDVNRSKSKNPFKFEDEPNPFT